MDKASFHHIFKEAEKRLKEAGIEVATAEVEIILEHLLDIDRLNVYLYGSDLIDDEILEKFNHIIKKRITRYPLQLILGEAYFYGRKYTVTPDVMVPTPETEILCQLAINYAKNESINNPKILDVGVGSGVVSVTIAAELPGSEIMACDISEAAIKVARINAIIHRVENDIIFVQSDGFAGIDSSEKFDLILSNPPYISDDDYKELPPEVLADPKLSLVSGKEGMDMVKRLIAEAPAYLKKNGRLMFEIGYNQADMVAEISGKNRRYRSLVIMKDLNDIDRVIILTI